MAEYVIEIVKGGDHLFLCKGDVLPLKDPSDFLERMQPKFTVYLDPKPRNAIRVEGYREAKGFVESMMLLGHSAFRKLARVDKEWDRPITINLRRDSPNRGVLDTPSLQRMYQFKEQA